MQPLVTTAQWTLMAQGQEPRVKLEIELAPGNWMDLTEFPAPGGKNYLKDMSFTSGGANMTPDPIAGEFSAVIHNPGNIFHRKHPTSGCQGYFRAGRKVRISLGGNYPPSPGWAGGIEYWQRIIGYMDEPQFSSDTFEVSIKGLDYMRRLSDMKFTNEVSAFAATPIDNYWGALSTLNSVSTTVLGAELYNPSGGVPGAGDAAEIGGGEGNRAAPFWAVRTNGATAISSQGQIGGFSAWELEFIANPAGVRSVVWYAGVCAVIAGQEYQVSFNYVRTAGDDSMRFTLYDGATPRGGTGQLDPVNGVWETATFTFTPSANGNLDLWLVCRVIGAPSTWRVDQISIKSITGKVVYYYDMPAGCTGIYSAELDEGSGFEAVWPGKQKGEGWYYDPILNQFYFDEDKAVNAGVANLRIYYYIAQQAQNVVADIIVKAYPTVYANRAAALAAMGAPATGVSIDRVRFKAGSTYVAAIKQLCERCNWRFYWNWNGDPRFVPAPSPGPIATFIPFLPQHITSPKLYQNLSEIWNRIVIEGEKVAELVGWDENMPSELKDEAFNNASMLTYGTRTKNIKNDLFQDLASITAMCGILLAAYKDPKWYLDFETPYNATPLVVGDTIDVQELLDITLANAVYLCLIRNQSVSLSNVTYICETNL